MSVPSVQWELSPEERCLDSRLGQAKVALSPLPSSSLPSVFGHISFRSDWELVKVDFRPSFSKQCSEDDYSSWDLTNLQVGLGRGRGGQAGRRWGPTSACYVLPCQAGGTSSKKSSRNPPTFRGGLNKATKVLFAPVEL